MRKTAKSNLCIASLSLLSRASYYVKPGEDSAPLDLEAKGVVAVRGVIAATGKLLTADDPEVEQEGDEGRGNG